MKILLLGSTSVGATDIVACAQKQGHTIVVADNLNETRAKKAADACWNISTADEGSLVRRIQEEHIEAVIAAVSEFNWIQAIKLSKICHIKTCIDQRTWDFFNDKKMFHDKAQEIHFPITEFYRTKEEVDKYPVIVKPVDNCGARGISIAYCRQELEEAIGVAKHNSKMQEYIIERYYDNCEEVSVYGVVINGKFVCNAIIDRKIIQLSGMKAPKATMLKYPSKYQKMLEKYFPRFEELFRICETKYAICFFQGVIYQQELYIYEGEVRPSSSQLYHIIEYDTGVCRLDIMLQMLEDQKIEIPDIREKGSNCALVINPLLREGVISKIEDEKIQKADWVIKYDRYVKEEDSVPDFSTQVKVFGILQIVGKSEEELAERLDYIKQNLRVYDVGGNNMIVYE